MERLGQLENKEQKRFQERFWIAQDLVWVVSVLVILAAAMGATGNGGLLARQTTVVNGIVIDIPRIARREALEKFSIRSNLPPRKAGASGKNGSLVIGISKNYLKNFRIVQAQPLPKEQKISNGMVFYTFETTNKEDFIVNIFVKPYEQKITSIHFNIDGEIKTMSVITLP